MVIRCGWKGEEIMTQILARKKHGIPNGSRLVDVLIVIAVAVICLFTLYPM